MSATKPGRHGTHCATGPVNELRAPSLSQDTRTSDALTDAHTAAEHNAHHVNWTSGAARHGHVWSKCLLRAQYGHICPSQGASVLQQAEPPDL